jgi:hypothetical protein
MNSAKVKRDARLRRHRRVRRRVVGTAERPRLAVFRSNKQIYAQLIDDRAGRTLAAAGSPTSKGDGDKKAAGSAPSWPPRPRRPASPRWCSTVAATSTRDASARWPKRPARAVSISRKR